MTSFHFCKQPDCSSEAFAGNQYCGRHRRFEYVGQDCAWCGGESFNPRTNTRGEVFCSKSHRDSSNRALKRLPDKENYILDPDRDDFNECHPWSDSF